MKIDINFTDEELLRIINSVGPDAEVIFAEGYEIPSAYPPLPLQQETFVFECQPAGSETWGPQTLWPQGEPNWVDLTAFEYAPSSVWGRLMGVSPECLEGPGLGHSQDRDLEIAA